MHYQVISISSYFLYLFLSPEPFSSLAMHTPLWPPSLLAVKSILQAYFKHWLFFSSRGEAEEKNNKDIRYLVFVTKVKTVLEVVYNRL